MILIICLWLMAALSLLALGLAYRLRLDGKVVAYRYRAQEMRELARGLVALAMARTDSAASDCTFYGQAWAWPVELSPDNLGGLDSDALKRFTARSVVFDELAKLNVNVTGREQLRGLEGVDDETASAILDWRDKDDTPSPMGAESAQYRMLVPSYKCKNADLDSVYELLVVRGISGRTFFGPDGDCVGVPDGVGGWRPAVPGLRDYLTVYGNGRLNLNTASETVLSTIPGITPDIAREIGRRRAGNDGVERTGDDVPFAKFDELLAVGGMTEFAKRQLELACVLASDTFDVRVEVADRTTSAAIRVDAVLVRGDKGSRCVSWRER